MSGHTRGPWEVKPGEWLYVVVPTKNPPFLCEVMNRGDADEPSGEDWANARLIAAAPDLLGACYLMVQATKAPVTELALRTACRIAEAAIAKAEGAE